MWGQRRFSYGGQNSLPLCADFSRGVVLENEPPCASRMAIIPFGARRMSAHIQIRRWGSGDDIRWGIRYLRFVSSVIGVCVRIYTLRMFFVTHDFPPILLTSLEKTDNALKREGGEEAQKEMSCCCCCCSGAAIQFYERCVHSSIDRSSDRVYKNPYPSCFE